MTPLFIKLSGLRLELVEVALKSLQSALFAVALTTDCGNREFCTAVFSTSLFGWTTTLRHNYSPPFASQNKKSRRLNGYAPQAAAFAKPQSGWTSRLIPARPAPPGPAPDTYLRLGGTALFNCNEIELFFEAGFDECTV